MNTRKDRLRSIFSGVPGEGEQTTPEPESAQEPQRRATSGAVKAMGLSLGSLSEEVQEARKLREALAAGETIIELDTALLERSPFKDRLTEGAQDDEEFTALVQSMREHGQQVPILVRPHPQAEKAARGLYQIAYGHRRVQAARELGIPVRAVVRDLGDDDLAVAQGKENAERRSLSFIERAFFAKALLDHGFERQTAQAALAVHKSEISRLLQVAETVPLEIAEAIGPAPKVGRPRWLALGELLSNDASGLVEKETKSPEFLEADSDTRFQRLYNSLEAAHRTKRGRPRKVAKLIESSGGKPIAEVLPVGKAVRLTIPETAGKQFAQYLLRRLPELHADYEEDYDD